MFKVFLSFTLIIVYGSSLLVSAMPLNTNTVENLQNNIESTVAEDITELESFADDSSIRNTRDAPYGCMGSTVAGTMATGAAGGALLGAAIGSVAPGLGTGLGAIAGGVKGAMSGLAGGVMLMKPMCS